MNTAWSKPTKYIAAIGMALLGIYILYLSSSIIPLLILAALLAVIVRPGVQWLQRTARLPLSLAVIVVYLGVLILTPLAMLLVVPAIADAVRYVLSLDYQAIMQAGIVGLRAWLTGIRDSTLIVPGLDAYIDPLITAVLDVLQPAAPVAPTELPAISSILAPLRSALTATFGAAASVIGAVLSSVVLSIFVLLASMYINLGAHTYRDSFISLVPSNYKPEISTLLVRIDRMWNAFFRGQVTLMLVIGLISWIGLTALGIPGAISLGIIAGLLELIPNLGPIIATIPAVIVALLQGSDYLPVSNLTTALLVIAFYILIQQLENSIIVPRVLGEAVELPPLVVMTGVLVGTTVGGILGALLATPVIATGREILSYVYRKMQGLPPFPPEAEKPVRKPFQLPDWVQRLLPSRPAAPPPPAEDAEEEKS